MQQVIQSARSLHQEEGRQQRPRLLDHLRFRMSVSVCHTIMAKGLWDKRTVHEGYAGSTWTLKRFHFEWFWPLKSQAYKRRTRVQVLPAWVCTPYLSTMKQGRPCVCVFTHSGRKYLNECTPFRYVSPWSKFKHDIDGNPLIQHRIPDHEYFSLVIMIV